MTLSSLMSRHSWTTIEERKIITNCRHLWTPRAVPFRLFTRRHIDCYYFSVLLIHWLRQGAPDSDLCRIHKNSALWCNILLQLVTGVTICTFPSLSSICTYTTPEKHQSRHVRLCLVWVQPVCVALYVLYSAELTFLACVHNESAFIGMNGCHLGVQSVSWQQKLAVFGKITDKTAGE